jgi:hypothetical protein
MFFLYKNSPDPALVPLLETGAAAETDRAYQISSRKGAQDEVFTAGGRQPSPEDVDRCLSMFFGG